MGCLKGEVTYKGDGSKRDGLKKGCLKKRDDSKNEMDSKKRCLKKKAAPVLKKEIALVFREKIGVLKISRLKKAMSEKRDGLKKEMS